MHNSLSLKLGRGAIPGCGFEPDSRPNLPPVGNRPNRRPAGGQPVTASRTCETGSCARIPPRKSRFFPAKAMPRIATTAGKAREKQTGTWPGQRRKGRCSCDKDSDRHRKSIPKNMAGVYIHIPFCKSRCHYCDFFSGTSLERRRELLAALHAELELRAGTAGPFPAGEPLVPGESPNSPDHDLPNGPGPGFPNHSGKRSGRHNPLRRKPDRDALLRRRHAEPAHAA